MAPPGTTSNAKHHPEFASRLKHLASPLAPLVQVNTCQRHPDFPRTLLNYYVLTSEQLDDLATFYHQRWPSELTTQYPCPVQWTGDLSLEGKRRKFGRFIGLRGCESPVRIKTEEDMLEEARQARDADDEAMRRKTTWYM